jgi:F-type H+-transporting ATPase subunit epsilon
MPVLHLKIVTAEQQVLDEEADLVIAPGGAGELGILPRHIPIITTLKPGELRVRRTAGDQIFAIAGGFMEVRNEGERDSAVTILADAAERAEEIDLERAEKARQQAEQTLAESASAVDSAAAQAALLRAIARIRVAEAHGRRHARPPQQQG